MTTREENTISVSDPLVTLAGIKRFGLASDGSDLRDLEAAIVRLRSERDVNAALVDVNLASCDVRDAELARLRSTPEPTEGMVEAIKQAIAYADVAAQAEGMPAGKQATRLTATGVNLDGSGYVTAEFDVKKARAALRAMPLQDGSKK